MSSFEMQPLKGGFYVAQPHTSHMRVRYRDLSDGRVLVMADADGLVCPAVAWEVDRAIWAAVRGLERELDTVVG